MHIKTSFSRKVFVVFNYIFLTLTGFLCLFPFWHLGAISFSNPHAVALGQVTLWPVDFTTGAYEYILKDGSIVRAFINSFIQVGLGTAVNLLFIVLTAYPLSRDSRQLFGRNVYMAFFFLTTLISGGMIPGYLVTVKMGLKNSIWALIIPTALPVGNMILQMNFIRNLPKELEESARIDGANELQVMWKILLPLLKPSLATVALFCIVRRWNQWMPATLYLDDRNLHPLSTYIRSTIVNFQALLEGSGEYLQIVDDLNLETGRAATLFIGALPVMIVYPFLQKYFTKGLTIGSVKG